jgi:hypothetical protein
MGAFCCLHHPAAVQRNAIAAFRHRFTLRQTRRTVPIIFSIESCRPALVTVQLTQFLAAPVGWLDPVRAGGSCERPSEARRDSSAVRVRLSHSRSTLERPRCRCNGGMRAAATELRIVNHSSQHCYVGESRHPTHHPSHRYPRQAAGLAGAFLLEGTRDQHQTSFWAHK